MSTYTPDYWVVLEIKYPKEEKPLRKVFAGWAGSYLYGQSWKLSSGVTNTRDFEDRFEFDNHSGSLYICRKNSEGMNAYMAGIFESWCEEIKETEVTMKLIGYGGE